MLRNQLGEGDGLLGEAIARREQAATDQQHCVRSVEVKHLGDALEGHTAGGDRDAGTDTSVRRAGLVGEAAAGFRRVAEAAAVIREDDSVGTEWLKKAAALNQPDAVKELKKRTG